MLNIIRRQRHLLNSIFVGGQTSRRKFLSEAYKCSEAWQNRLLNPAFEKIDFDNVYHQLDLDFQANKRINLLDIDMFVSSLTDYTYKNELEDILTKLREAPECGIMPERTSHAAIRFYLDKAPKEDVFNILSNRLTFGIFPDNYLANMLMDRFLKESDTISAVKVAVLHMLQEDFDHPITKLMGLYCCYNYLASPHVWQTLKEPEPDPDEEVQKVRVPYLRNPYYDDHFDIKDPNHLIGKTLQMFGSSIGDTLGLSSQLVGLILHEKYEETVKFLNEAIKNNSKMYSESISMAKDYLKNKPKQESAEAEGGEGESKPTENKASVDVSEEQNERIKNISLLLGKVDKMDLVEGNILSDLENMLKKAVDANQEKDISHQCEVYKQWEKDRLDHIQEEIDRSKLEELKDKIDKTKKELKLEEQRLFYFDKEDEFEIVIKAQEEAMKSVVYYKGKGKEREKSVDDYNPPDVHQKSSHQDM